jgi:glycyl-tRNA synthetase beta chain
VAQVLAFIRERLSNLMRERGYTANEVAAVLEVESEESKPNRLDLVPAKLEAVRAFGKLAEAASLAAANKRISNILRQARAEGTSPFACLRPSPASRSRPPSMPPEGPPRRQGRSSIAGTTPGT